MLSALVVNSSATVSTSSYLPDRRLRAKCLMDFDCIITYFTYEWRSVLRESWRVFTRVASKNHKMQTKLTQLRYVELSAVEICTSKCIEIVAYADVRFKYAPKARVVVKYYIPIHKQKPQNTHRTDTITICWTQCGRNMHSEMYWNYCMCRCAVQIHIQNWCFS